MNAQIETGVEQCRQIVKRSKKPYDRSPSLYHKQESCRYARLLGLTDATLPASYAVVQQYMREALASGEIAVGPAARFIAQKVLFPPIPLLRKPLWMIVRAITVGQLPAEIRQAYGLRWTWRQRIGFRLARNVGHLLRHLFPKALSRSPLVSFARCRVRGEFSRPMKSIPSADDAKSTQATT